MAFFPCGTPMAWVWLHTQAMEINSLSTLARVGQGLSELRFTVFTPSIIEGCDAVYQKFFGFPAENEAVQKRLFRSEYFTVKERIKCAVVQLGPRLDITISPDASATETAELTSENAAQMQQMIGGFAVIGNDNGMRDGFIQSAQELLPRLGELKRLAVVEHYLWSAKSKEESYTRLAIFLPGLRLDPASSSDLHFRINRAKTLDFGGDAVTINRLGEWTSPALIMAIQVNNIDGATTTAFATSCKTDVNTAPKTDLSKLADSQKQALVQSLFELSAGLAENGDTP